MFERIRYMLLQVRNADDPMRRHEVESFARVLGTTSKMIRVFDLLGGPLGKQEFEGTDMFLLGGSGQYSAAGDGDWLETALESLRLVHDQAKPTFASCWGFQAMARAMGGRVMNDLLHAEVGTHRLTLTESGKKDPLFGPLGETFFGQMGHEDCVDALPPQTTLLASSKLVEFQAYRFNDAPIYCTQFHPELNCSDLLKRVTHYPVYIERIAGVPADRFQEMIWETPEAEALLKRFVAMVFGD